MSADNEAKVNDFLKQHGIKTRADWGATAPKKTLDPDWDYVTIAAHHSGHSAETEPKKVQSKHMNDRNWDDVGYHFMIGPDGTIYEGRRLTCKGSHILNKNTGKIGILVMGDFEGFFASPPPTQAQMMSFKRLVRALKSLFALKVLGGHLDWDSGTECPGYGLYSLLPNLCDHLGLVKP